MKKLTKTMTIIASSMIVIGILLAIIGYSTGAKLSITNSGGGFKVLDSGERKIETYPLSSFSKMNVQLLDADIEVIPSNEYKVQIEQQEDQEVRHEIKNDTLVIEEKERKSRKIFNINLGFTNSTQTVVKIYFPSGEELKDVSIVNNFGDIHIEDMAIEKLDIRASDGDLMIKNVQANELKIVNQFGDITGYDVKTKDLNIELTDGEAEFNKISANFITVKNGFGDTILQDVTSEGLKMESNDGDIEIHGLLLGESIIESKFGDVTIQLLNKESELGYNIRNDFGDITIDNNDYQSQAVQKTSSTHNLEIDSKDGDVEISFLD